MRNNFAKNWKLWGFLGLIALLIICNHIFGWSAYLENQNNLKFLRNMVDENLALAILVYCIITVVGCVALALPGITFAILAGVIFGPFLGTICCAFAATLGAGVAFIAGRFFLKDSLKPFVMKNKYLKKWLFDEAGKNDIFILMITRLVPLFPYNLQNFAYGITDIAFGKYMLYTFLFMIPGTAMYTIGTAGLVDSENRWLYIGIAVVLAAFVMVLGNYFKKKYVQGDNEPEVDEEKKNLPESGCITCGKCTQTCAFLRKYKLDFSNPEKLKELQYHCFLCGRCTEVCPAGVDGREYMLNLRKQTARENNGKVLGYKHLQWEKTDYRYKNYSHGSAKSVLFPGCNYPSFYPKTMKKLMTLMEECGIGTIFDCCGKPVEEIGVISDSVAKLNWRLKKQCVEEVIFVCPNCYDFLKGKLDVKFTTIYEKLEELGVGQKLMSKDISRDNAGEEDCIPKTDLKIFLPCPDRKEKLWIQSIKIFLPEHISYLERAQCCGLGGCSGEKEPELVQNFMNQTKKELDEAETKDLYLYCASCAGNFTKGQVGNIHHILNDILESMEEADVKHSMLNRRKSRKL